MILSAVLIGLFYVFCYYAATVYFGPDRMASEFLGFNDADPWGGMANEVLPGIGSLLVTFAILNSSPTPTPAPTRPPAIFCSAERACCLPPWRTCIRHTGPW